VTDTSELRRHQSPGAKKGSTDVCVAMWSMRESAIDPDRDFSRRLFRGSVWLKAQKDHCQIAGRLQIFRCTQKPMMPTAFHHEFIVQRRRIDHIQKALPFMEEINSIVIGFSVTFDEKN
jgi:hypothetical protein